MARRRGGRKRAIGTRAPMLVPLRPNERGVSTLFRTSSPMASASAFLRSSMIAPGSASRWWRTRRSRACAWRGSSIASSSGAAGQDPIIHHLTGHARGKMFAPANIRLLFS